MLFTRFATCLALLLLLPAPARGDEPVPPAPTPPASPAPLAAPAPTPPPTPPRPPAAPPEPRIVHTPPGTATPGTAVWLELEVLHPELVRSIRVHFRTPHRRGFRTTSAHRTATGRWLARLPRPAVDDERLEYFVTVTRTDGATRGAFASRSDPHPIIVRPSTDDAEEAEELARRDGLRLDLVAGGEYVDFGARRDDNGALCDEPGGECRDDSYVLYTAARYHFLRRVRSVGLRVERIAGTTTHGGAERDVGLVGATVDLELRVTRTVSISLLGLLGANEEAVQPGAGLAVSVGLGEPAQLDATLRGMMDVGWVFESWMRWQTVPNLPLGAGLELTTQPGDNPAAALRLLMEIGRKLGRHVTLGLRAGYGARSLEGGGVTLGGWLQVSLRDLWWVPR